MRRSDVEREAELGSLSAVSRHKLDLEEKEWDTWEKERDAREKRGRQQREIRDKELREREDEEKKERQQELQLFQHEQQHRDKDRQELQQQRKQREKQHVTEQNQRQEQHHQYLKQRRQQRDDIHRQHDQQDRQRQQQQEYHVKHVLYVLRTLTSLNLALPSATRAKGAEAFFRQNKEFMNHITSFGRTSEGKNAAPDANCGKMSHKEFIEKIISFTEPTIVFGATSTPSDEHNCFILICFKENYWMFYSKNGSLSSPSSSASYSVASLTSAHLSRLEFTNPMTIGRVSKETHSSEDISCYHAFPISTISIK